LEFVPVASLCLLCFVMLTSIVATFYILVSKIVEIEGEKQQAEDSLTYLKAVLAEQSKRPSVAAMTEEQMGYIMQMLQNLNKESN